MELDPGKAANDSKKRKFDVYSFDQSLVHFMIDEKIYSVDEALINDRCGGVHWSYEIGHEENSKKALPKHGKKDGIAWAHCAACPHDWMYWNGYTSCSLRGFIHWISEQELHSDEMIKQLDYPAEWNEISKDKPLALAMAVELYINAWLFRLRRLAVEMLKFIFDHSKKTRSVTKTHILRMVYSHNMAGKINQLQRLLVHIYYKWCDQASIGREDDYPSGFLLDITKLRAKRNDDILAGGDDDSMMLTFSDYHSDGSEKFCPTRNGDTGDTWVIY